MVRRVASKEAEEDAPLIVFERLLVQYFTSEPPELKTQQPMPTEAATAHELTNVTAAKMGW
ncbi:hypothetical protein ACRQ5Q_44145 (plasmid) [Bradyrhizobium sp. PMVTL-01]|uniref:hypothetical protein n=1 Tax=Bradyrhizobium sp. PMVTL-01 TaxID=3434999 RepID=UPI003F71CAA7